MKGFFVIVITAFLVSWLGAQARSARARQVRDTWLFLPIMGMRVLYGAVAIFGLGLVVGGFFGPPQDRTIVVSGGWLFIAFAGITWPKAIEVSHLGLRQRSWWGRWKTIAWPEVLCSDERRDGSVVVRAKHGKVVLSSLHADRERFLAQLAEYSPASSRASNMSRHER